MKDFWFMVVLFMRNKQMVGGRQHRFIMPDINAVWKEGILDTRIVKILIEVASKFWVYLLMRPKPEFPVTSPKLVKRG